jgi:hypothetical protein
MHTVLLALAVTELYQTAVPNCKAMHISTTFGIDNYHYMCNVSLLPYIPVSDLSDVSCDVRPYNITGLRGASHFKDTWLVCNESLYC